MIPWPIIKMIAEASGCRWRFRVCRKLRNIIPFPQVCGNLVPFADDLPFHKNKTVRVSCSCAEFCIWVAAAAPPRFIIAWRIVERGESVYMFRAGFGLGTTAEDPEKIQCVIRTFFKTPDYSLPLLPWPIIKMIAEASGCRWRFRVCRKLRDIIPFPQVHGNVVNYAVDLPFHKNKIVNITSCHHEVREWASAATHLIIVWQYDENIKSTSLSHKDFHSIHVDLKVTKKCLFGILKRF